ncbi:hypothetical protein EYF80_019331 [Liparis tanakae]|uniref:Ceramide kinase PH domain-containing protein n=1 Tax=Liparis tanakae TaxID=230148 RepID=A0A4Z2HZL2_9TELE|nr:hypothetical protein EYF80_019331 [Liparis tanakae]
MMEERVRLLSSKLFLKHRQVEVVLSRSVLAWKETERSRTRSSGIISNSAEAEPNPISEMARPANLE